MVVVVGGVVVVVVTTSVEEREAIKIRNLFEVRGMLCYQNFAYMTKLC